MAVDLDYNESAYAELKRRIDAVLLERIDAARVEQRKSRLLAEFLPYVEFLQRLTGADGDVVRAILLELETDEPFFATIRDALQRLTNWAREMNTGDLRVHAHTVYTVTRLTKPSLMVETGVANGKSSTFILRAMEKNRAGRLYSVDLPTYPEAAPVEYDGGLTPTGLSPGWVVPDHLRRFWDLQLGDARELLPKLRRHVGPIDIFMHDSLHTYDHMAFELDFATEWVRGGGLILCDDIRSNSAFPERCRPGKGGAFGTFGYLLADGANDQRGRRSIQG